MFHRRKVSSPNEPLRIEIKRCGFGAKAGPQYKDFGRALTLKQGRLHQTWGLVDAQYKNVTPVSLMVDVGAGAQACIMADFEDMRGCISIQYTDGQGNSHYERFAQSEYDGLSLVLGDVQVWLYNPF